MYQFVNLYQPLFRQRPELLSTATMLTLIAVPVVLSLPLFLHANSTLEGLQHTSANLALNHAQLSARLDTASAVPEASEDRSLDERIAEIRDLIDERRVLLESIDGLATATTAGFGDVFETLARTSLPGLWLTGIRIEREGSIELSGSALDPVLVPRYLRLIAKAHSLRNLGEGTVEILRPGGERSEIDFILSYDAAAAGR